MARCALPSCGLDVEASTSRRGRPRKFCSDSCRATAHRSGVASCSESGCHQKVRARGLCSTHYNWKYYPNRHLRRKVCERCGANYETTRTDGRFCSYACRDSSRRDAKLPVHVGPVPPRCEIPARHPCRRPRRRLPGCNWSMFVAGSCKWCDGYFVAPAADVDRASLYCSKRCLWASCRSRRGRFLVAPHVRLEIYERDKWTCQLCGDPVDRDLDPSDVWAATLDHIECQSWALIPDHRPRNLRLAHRWCNSVRGDERYYTADVLEAA